MNINMQFRDFEGLSHLRAFVVDVASAAIEKFESAKPFRIDVVIGRETGRKGANGNFVAEVLLRGGFRQREIFVRKVGGDFHKAVRMCMRAVEKALRRDSRMKFRRHQRETIVPEWAAVPGEFEFSNFQREIK